MRPIGVPHGPLTTAQVASGLVVDFLLARTLPHVQVAHRGAGGQVFERFRNPGSSLGSTGRSDNAAAREAASHLILVPPAALSQVRWPFAAFDGGPGALPPGTIPITPWVGPAVNVAMGLF